MTKWQKPDGTFRRVQTRGGSEAVIYAIHEGQEWCILGAIKGGDTWLSCSWRDDGRCNCHVQQPGDLILVPETVTRWVNLYPGGKWNIFDTQEEADTYALRISERLGNRAHPVTVEV